MIILLVPQFETCTFKLQKNLFCIRILKMNKRTIAKLVPITLLLDLLGASVPRMVHAELISTQKVIELQQRQVRITRINEMLAREEIREQLIRLGVDPKQARERVAALTDTELVLLEQQLDDLPAGGAALAISGVGFFVLLLLDLMGVINIFDRD